MIVLPKVKSEPDNRWISQKFGMIGSAGIGKSEFWSHGQTLYLQCEAGLNHLSVMKVPITSWEAVREAVGALIQANVKKEFPWDTVVIDTIDKLVDYAQAVTQWAFLIVCKHSRHEVFRCTTRT